jgi:hypothetical protein
MKPKKKAPTILIADSPVRSPARDEIERAAYSIWEQEGRAQGREIEYWLQAETQLRQPAQQSATQA